MKRILLFFALAVMISSLACAQELPQAQEAAPQAEPTAAPEAGETGAQIGEDGELTLDFSLLTPDNPVATPVAVDPIDKPTPTPAPTPRYVYETYTNEALGVSFSIPYTWLLNPNTDHSTVVQFVEPKDERMEKDGYQTRVTIERFNRGLSQTAAEARDQLETTLEDLGSTFTNFTPGNIDSGDFGDARGYYCYYKADYNDGTKVYEMNGRIIVVAHDKSLYQIRITTPRDWYSYYNYVWRKLRSTIKYH